MHKVSRIEVFYVVIYSGNISLELASECNTWIKKVVGIWVTLILKYKKIILDVDRCYRGVILSNILIKSPTILDYAGW